MNNQDRIKETSLPTGEKVWNYSLFKLWFNQGFCAQEINSSPKTNLLLQWMAHKLFFRKLLHAPNYFQVCQITSRVETAASTRKTFWTWPKFDLPLFHFILNNVITAKIHLVGAWKKNYLPQRRVKRYWRPATARSHGLKMKDSDVEVWVTL